jgi:hypothetical protein
MAANWWIWIYGEYEFMEVLQVHRNSQIEVNGWEGMHIITLISMPEMTFNIWKLKGKNNIMFNSM